MTTQAPFSRRDFLKTASAVGATLVIGFRFSGCARPDAGPPVVAQPNAWLRIGSDDSVVVIVDRSEMGQGVATSLPMLLAEELEADWSKIRIEFAPADPRYTNPEFGLQGTGGSTSVKAAFTPLRQAGAAAREVLIAAAARTWQVDPKECRAENGSVLHEASGKRARFGALVPVAVTLPVPENVPLKDPSAWTIIGTRKPRLDTPAKVDGSAVFGMDVTLPGMLVAVIARPPVFGGTVAGFDATKAKAVRGVRDVVQVSSGVAVVADGYWPAHKGRDALTVTWNDGPNAAVSDASIARLFAQHAAAAGVQARNEGSGAAGLGQAVKKVEATYQLPFLAHATMEPMNATAHVRADGVDIWAPTQFQSGHQQLGAKIGGVPLEKVQVHTTYLGGGFGRRFESDFIQDALEVSKAMRAPVKVIWSREDDVRHDWYRAANLHVLRGGLDAGGRPVAWTHRVVAPSAMEHFFPGSVKNGMDAELVEGAVAMPYDIPNVQVDLSIADPGIPAGFFRSVNNSYNAFAVETFIDELAHAAGKDPYRFRRGLLTRSPRHLAALDLAAKQAGWGEPLPPGRARGIAVHTSFASYVAEVAEISLDPAGAVRVHRVVCAVDCGPVVNPAIVEAQMRGAIVMGLTAALFGEINIENGRVRQSNFNDYRMLTLAEVPPIEVYILPGDHDQGGVGEPGLPPIAPAVGNALFALTGKRIRKLPIGPTT